jgi:Uma2 family endonuclease
MGLVTNQYGGFSDKRKMELHNGKIVNMAGGSPAHGAVAVKIAGAFSAYLKGGVCKPFNSDVKVILEPGNHFYPDFSVVCDRGKVKSDGIHGAPDLVVEILSKTTAAYDRGHKFRTYETAGVRELWLVDIAQKSVEVYANTDGKFTLQCFSSVLEQTDLLLLDAEERVHIADAVISEVFPSLTLPIQDVFDDIDI